MVKKNVDWEEILGLIVWTGSDPKKSRSTRIRNTVWKATFFTVKKKLVHEILIWGWKSYKMWLENADREWINNSDRVWKCKHLKLVNIIYITDFKTQKIPCYLDNCKKASYTILILVRLQVILIINSNSLKSDWFFSCE